MASTRADNLGFIGPGFEIHESEISAPTANTMEVRGTLSVVLTAFKNHLKPFAATCLSRNGVPGVLDEFFCPYSFQAFVSRQ